MSTSLHRRIMRERILLEQDNEGLFKVFFDDSNLLAFDAFIIGPIESVYRHKLLKFRLQIPPRYPSVPPKVTYIQHSRNHIHPHIQSDGEVCLDLLDTSPEGLWRADFNIYTVLTSIRSILDNEPSRHAGDMPLPDTDNNDDMFVQYIGWRALLLEHVQHETKDPIKAFVKEFLRRRGAAILADVFAEKAGNMRITHLSDPYYNEVFYLDYITLIEDLRSAIDYAQGVKETPR